LRENTWSITEHRGEEAIKEMEANLKAGNQWEVTSTEDLALKPFERLKPEKSQKGPETRGNERKAIGGLGKARHAVLKKKSATVVAQEPAMR